MSPEVAITSPGDGSGFIEGDPVRFDGTAEDTENGDLATSLTWTSNLDGPIGAGGSFAINSLSLGTHTITATVTDKGFSGNDSISITIAGLPSGSIWIEAESGLLNNTMLVEQDLDASGGAYVLAARGADGSVEYTFQITESGDYVVWGRVIAQDSSSNSFYVAMDNGDEHLWSMQRSEDWLWDMVSNRSGPDPSVFYLEQGFHTLRISKRENNAQIDRILITNDLNFLP
ncbi:MAG: hypothetical protein DRH90_18510 [Deltaproteobacteria bacterium]|nr:MAG: hypothetical protein DRH90_18510 [Deltaproteobacteria bacterium]